MHPIFISESLPEAEMIIAFRQVSSLLHKGDQIGSANGYQSAGGRGE